MHQCRNYNIFNIFVVQRCVEREKFSEVLDPSSESLKSKVQFGFSSAPVWTRSRQNLNLTQLQPSTQIFRLSIASCILLSYSGQGISRVTNFQTYKLKKFVTNSDFLISFIFATFFFSNTLLKNKTYFNT